MERRRMSSIGCKASRRWWSLRHGTHVNGKLTPELVTTFRSIVTVVATHYMAIYSL
jgi:hypothetical protein